MCDEESDQGVPTYFDLLNPADKEDYEKLKAELSSSDRRYNRNKRIETFREMLDLLKRYCVRDDEDTWKRCLVCGICWLDDDIAINTRQLRIVLGKSKLSINGALSKMEYETITSKSSDTSVLVEKIPLLKGNFNEARQWTVRRYTPVCEMTRERIDVIETREVGQQLDADAFDFDPVFDYDCHVLMDDPTLIDGFVDSASDSLSDLRF